MDRRRSLHFTTAAGFLLPHVAAGIKSGHRHALSRVALHLSASHTYIRTTNVQAGFTLFASRMACTPMVGLTTST